MEWVVNSLYFILTGGKRLNWKFVSFRPRRLIACSSLSFLEKHYQQSLSLKEDIAFKYSFFLWVIKMIPTDNALLFENDPSKAN